MTDKKEAGPGKDRPLDGVADQVDSLRGTTSQILQATHIVRPVEPIYNAIVLECERQRSIIKFSMERLSEIGGLPDRYYAKILNPQTVTGRQATWASLQRVCDVLWPDGFDLVIRSKPGPKLIELKARYDALYNVKSGDER